MHSTACCGCCSCKSSAGTQNFSPTTYICTDLQSHNLFLDLTLLLCRLLHHHSNPQDLEYLISKAVNPKNADYAVVTGVQIHNWASDLDDVRIPSMEFVAPARAYVVVNGEKIDLDLQQVRCADVIMLMLSAGWWFAAVWRVVPRCLSVDVHRQPPSVPSSCFASMIAS
jgi:hypothetical protein